MKKDPDLYLASFKHRYLFRKASSVFGRDLIELETQTDKVISYPGKHVYTQLACHIMELLENLHTIWSYPCFI